jgi:hypothetical protein
MAHIPGVNQFGFRFYSASAKQRIVNRASHDALGCGVADRGVVLLWRKRHDGEPVADFVDEQQGLIAAQAVLAGESCRVGVQFRQTMSPAAALFFVRFEKNSEACLVVYVVFKEAWKKN